MPDAVDLDGVAARYQLDGPPAATPVVLLNSLGTDLRMWDRQIADLADRYRVIRFDARGQGATPAPRSPYSLADLGRDAIGLVDHLGIERFHVCGVSLGGAIALWLAAHHPDRLLTATFANTAARIGTAEGWEQRIAAVRHGGMRAIRDVVLERYFSASFRATEPTTVEAFGDSLETHDPEGYVGACTALRDADLGGVLDVIDLPSLVVCGSHDVSTPPEQGRYLSEALGAATLVELDGAGHLSNVEQARAFNDALGHHLAAAS